MSNSEHLPKSESFPAELLKVTSYFDKLLGGLLDQIKKETDPDIRRILLERFSQEGRNKDRAIEELAKKGNAPANVFNNCHINGVNSGPGTNIVGNTDPTTSTSPTAESAPETTQKQPSKNEDVSDAKSPANEGQTEKRNHEPVPEKFQAQLRELIDLMDSDDRKNLYGNRSNDREKLHYQATLPQKHESSKRLRSKLTTLMKDPEFKDIIHKGTYQELNLRVRYLNQVLNFFNDGKPDDPSATQGIVKELISIEGQLKELKSQTQTSTSAPEKASPKKDPESTQSAEKKITSPPPTSEARAADLIQRINFSMDLNTLRNSGKSDEEVKSIISSHIATLNSFSELKKYFGPGNGPSATIDVLEKMIAEGSSQQDIDSILNQRLIGSTDPYGVKTKVRELAKSRNSEPVAHETTPAIDATEPKAEPAFQRDPRLTELRELSRLTNQEFTALMKPYENVFQQPTDLDKDAVLKQEEQGTLEALKGIFKTLTMVVDGAFKEINSKDMNLTKISLEDALNKEFVVNNPILTTKIKDRISKLEALIKEIDTVYETLSADLLAISQEKLENQDFRSGILQKIQILIDRNYLPKYLSSLESLQSKINEFPNQTTPQDKLNTFLDIKTFVNEIFKKSSDFTLYTNLEQENTPSFGEVIAEINKDLKRQPENLKDFFTQYSKDFDKIFEPKVVDVGGDLFVFSKYQLGNFIISLTKPKNSKHWNLIFFKPSGKIFTPDKNGIRLNENLIPNPKIEYYCFLSYIKGYDSQEPEIDFSSFLNNKKYSSWRFNNKIQEYYKALTSKKAEHPLEKRVRTIFNDWGEKIWQATTTEGYKDAYRTLDLGELTPDFTKPPARTYIVDLCVIKEYNIRIGPANETFVLSVTHAISPHATDVRFSFYPKNKKFIDYPYTLNVPIQFDPDICPLLKAYTDAGGFNQNIDIPEYLSFLAKNVSIESNDIILRYSQYFETGESKIAHDLIEFIDNYEQQTRYPTLPFDKTLFQNYYKVVENFPDLRQSLGIEINFLETISGTIEEILNSKNLESAKYKELADLLNSQDTLEKPMHFKRLLKEIKSKLILYYLDNLKVPISHSNDFRIENIKDSSEVSGFFQEIFDFKETVDLFKEQLESEKKCEVRSVVKIIEDLQKTKYLQRVLEPSMSFLIKKLFVDSFDFTNAEMLEFQIDKANIHSKEVKEIIEVIKILKSTLDVENTPILTLEQLEEIKTSLELKKESPLISKYPTIIKKIQDRLLTIDRVIKEIHELNREIEENSTPKIQEKEEEQTEKQMKQEVIERLKDLTGKYREFLQGKIKKADIDFFDRLHDRNEEIIVKFSNKYISDTMLQLLFYCNKRIFQIGKSDKYPLDEKTRVRSSENCIDTYNKLTPEEKSLLPNDISIIWEKTVR